MLPPEIQRIVLLIGMAAVGYLLILAWNDDMAAAKSPTVYSEAPLTSTNLSTTPTATVGDDFAVTETEIPTESKTRSLSSAEGTSSLDRLVKVETPVLRIWIDLVGGDIVRVQLPTFPVSLDQPDTPFLLMDRNATHTYIAQSALIGPDGIDQRFYADGSP